SQRAVAGVRREPTLTHRWPCLSLVVRRMETRFSKILSALGWLMSTTRKIIDILKTGTPAESGRALRLWNIRWFQAEVVMATLLVAASVRYPSARAKGWLLLPMLLLGWWRVNEIAYAFYRDALHRLAIELQRSDLKPTERVQMAMKSYIGMGINFAQLFYF